MKKLTVQKCIFSVLLAAAGVVAHAQAGCGQGFDDSSCGSRALTGIPKIALKNQELQPMGSPVYNTNVTQVVQPNVTTTSGSASGFRFATAWANCGGGILLGGGGSCRADNGYAAMPTSQPNGNNWQVTCDAFQGGNVVASAWATCSN